MRWANRASRRRGRVTCSRFLRSVKICNVHFYEFTRRHKPFPTSHDRDRFVQFPLLFWGLSRRLDFNFPPHSFVHGSDTSPRNYRGLRNRVFPSNRPFTERVNFIRQKASLGFISRNSNDFSNYKTLITPTLRIASTFSSWIRLNCLVTVPKYSSKERSNKFEQKRLNVILLCSRLKTQSLSPIAVVIVAYRLFTIVYLTH